MQIIIKKYSKNFDFFLTLTIRHLSDLILILQNGEKDVCHMVLLYREYFERN